MPPQTPNEVRPNPDVSTPTLKIPTENYPPEVVAIAKKLKNIGDADPKEQETILNLIKNNEERKKLTQTSSGHSED